MAARDPRVDAYIRKAPAFARPLLAELRRRLHRACPDLVETIKWRVPSFEFEGLLGGMAAFKAYCAFVFWKETLLRQDPTASWVIDRCGRMTELSDLPPIATFAKVIERAMQLNAEGIVVKRPKAKRKSIAPHPEFTRALAASKTASANFANFAPSQQREYFEWIGAAKREQTRQRRIATAVDWIKDGKHRNWKYERN